MAPSAEERIELLGRLVREQQLQSSPCTVVLSADTYQLNQADLAELPDEERRDAARWQIRERIDYSPEEAVIDLFEIAPFGGEKRPLTYIVSAQQKLLRDRIQLIEQSHLSVKAIDVPEFALRNICEYLLKMSVDWQYYCCSSMMAFWLLSVMELFIWSVGSGLEWMN